MKTLILLRHAEAAWGASIADFDRPLEPNGRAAAEIVGRSERVRGSAFDAAVVSPAARAVETWDGFIQGYGPAPQPQLEPAAYLASVASLIDLVRAMDEGVDRLLIVGHNPGLERLALLLSRNDGALRTRLAEAFPTGALAEIELPVTRWSDLGEAGGTLRRFVTPDDLAQETR